MRSRVLFNRHVLRYAHRTVHPCAPCHPVGTRAVSVNSAHSPTPPPLPPPPASTPPLDPVPPDEFEDAKSSKSPRSRPKRTQERFENPQLPSNLNILWSSQTPHTPLSAALPPPELLQEALNNLLITFHPQTQHRATYSTQNGLPVEPTLALYCPIEGGDYVIDETVRELARQTGAEVIVLDTVELAAGEWGAFGKGAYIHEAFQRTSNLYFFLSGFQLPLQSNYQRILYIYLPLRIISPLLCPLPHDL